MKKIVLATTLGLLIGLSILPLQQVFGQPGAGGGGPIGAHHSEQTFVVAAGSSQSFVLPDTQEPVRIDISFSALNGGTQTPSEIMYAVVNQDVVSLQFSWVGTNNDGSMQAGTSTPTGSHPIIAKICGGSCAAITNATLEVDSAATLPGTLKLATNIDAVGGPVTFRVNMWY